MSLNETGKRSDNSIVNVGLNVGKQSASQLEPFPSSVMTRKCYRENRARDEA